MDLVNIWSCRENNIACDVTKNNGVIFFDSDTASGINVGVYLTINEAEISDFIELISSLNKLQELPQKPDSTYLEKGTFSLVVNWTGEKAILSSKITKMNLELLFDSVAHLLNALQSFKSKIDRVSIQKPTKA